MNIFQRFLFWLLKISGYRVSPQRLLYLTIAELNEEGPTFISHIAFGRDLLRFFMETASLNCIVDDKGYFILLSNSWEKVLGYTKAELYAKPFYTFIHPHDVQETLKTYNEDLKNDLLNKPPLFTNRYICKNGDIVKLEWTRLGPIQGQENLNALGAARFLSLEGSINK